MTPGKPQRHPKSDRADWLLLLMFLALLAWFAFIGAATVIRWLVG